LPSTDPFRLIAPLKCPKRFSSSAAGVTDWLALDEECIAVDLDPVAGARVRNLGHAQVDPRRLGPEPGVAEVGDGVSAPGDDAHQHRRAAIRDVDRISPDVRIGEEHVEGCAMAFGIFVLS
jgi:hypothetical protein